MARYGAYDLVPRALRSLGRTAERIIPARAQAEERKARMGLAQTRTEFEIGQAEKAESHRTKAWEASEKAREEARTHRERAWKEGELPREAAKITAREQIEKAGREEAIRKEPVTGAWVAKTTAIQNEYDLINRYPNIQKGLEEGFSSKQNPKTDVYEKAEGVPLLKGEIFDRPDIFNLVDIINRDFVYQAESERDNPETTPERKAYLTKMLQSPEGKERLYTKNLRAFRDIQGAYGAIMPPGQQEVLKANIKRIEGRIDGLRKDRRTKELAKGKPTTGDVKVEWWDKGKKKHTRYMPKAQVESFSNQVISAGGSMGKPTGEKKPKEPEASKFNSLIGLIEKVFKKGEEKVAPENITMINDAANAIGYEYEAITRPLTKKEKRWWWFDPEKKTKYILRKKTGQTGVVKRKIEKPTKKADPLGIR